MARSSREIIPFSALPLDPTGPPGNAWGRFGPDDQLGMLNLLTPEVVASAARENILTGKRISLDWSLNEPSFPSYGRQAFRHEIIQKGAPGRCVNDDVLTFNTQGGSQWDGFRHYGNLEARRYYNNTTHEEIHSPSSTILGIDAWASSGGIVGRGILLDYKSWAEKNSIPLSPLTSTPIRLAHLHQLISSKNITFHPGDILFIRSGFISAYTSLTPIEQASLPSRPSADFAGLESTPEVLEWLWTNQFAAVAGDAPAFEMSPVGNPETDPRFVLHQWLLAGWGMPIGEMFDLEVLSEMCQMEGRWSFFVSSVPLKVPGGVASPPNAVAIF
ncbi:MAG: hypothetical protein MMC33_007677 [Icmadophila ericetorum]|nr:hypothetical protein [Icmadophila ericetorum]